MRFSIFKIGIIVTCLIFLASCTVNTIKPEPDSVCQKIAPFIEDGRTRKEEILEKPGLYRTVKVFETKDSRIYILRLFHSDPFYDLVLVFDRNDVLKRHSLIKPWY